MIVGFAAMRTRLVGGCFSGGMLQCLVSIWPRAWFSLVVTGEEGVFVVPMRPVFFALVFDKQWVGLRLA